MTPEEAALTGQANEQAEGNISSVKIVHNSKGNNWEVKIYNIDPYKALETAQDIDGKLQERYK